MADLPQTQTQEETFEPSQEVEVRIPWGRLTALMPTMLSMDLHEPLYIFGRGQTCNVLIETGHFSPILNVSKEHFSLHRDTTDDIVYLTDLSKNGTFINNIKVGRNLKHIIFNDDVIALGHPSSRIYTFVSNMNREDHEYPVNMKRKYFVSRKIGRGGFGEVRLAHDKRTFQKFAIKKICKYRSTTNIIGHAGVAGNIKTEVDILTTYSYVFIIQMLEVFETERDVFLVLEYMEGGELTKRILSASPFPEKEVKFVFYQILLAVRYLHMNGITHRDLKPQNVLLFSNSTFPLVKVTDFGLSKIVEESSLMETVCGTISYVAPEVLRPSEPYNKKVDVWSLGVLLFYMLSKTHPFGDEGREEIARNILSGKISWDVKAWKGISPPAKDLTRRMLTVNPQERVSTAEIFKQDWIEKDSTMRYRVDQLICDTFETDSSEETATLPIAKRARLSSTSN